MNAVRGFQKGVTIGIVNYAERVFGLQFGVVNVIRDNPVPFKVLRGMASIQAIRDRLDVEDADSVDIEALGAEGTEVSVPARGSVRPIVQDIHRHLCSSISYGGATSLAELKQLFYNDPSHYLIALSASARRESYER